MQKSVGKVFLSFEIGQKKCPKMKTLDILCQKYNCETIIENYRVVTKKIIIKL